MLHFHHIIIQEKYIDHLFYAIKIYNLLATQEAILATKCHTSFGNTNLERFAKTIMSYTIYTTIFLVSAVLRV